jgi:hypothetical protein
MSAGVNLQYNRDICNLEDVCGVCESGDSYSIVICCDGSKGRSRSELHSLPLAFLPTAHISLTSSPDSTVNSIRSIDSCVDSSLRAQRQLGSLLQVKFDAHGEVTRSKGALALFLQNLPAKNDFFNVLPGNFDGTKCSTPMTVFALLNDDVLSAVTPSTDQQQRIQSADLPSSVTEGIRSDLNAVLLNLCPGGIIPGSVRASILPVEYTASRRVTGLHNGTYVFLAGDSAMGLPLEKGLSYGWRIASRLCRYLTGSMTLSRAAEAYEQYFNHQVDEALDSVHRDYSRYIDTINSATALRYFLRPFTLHSTHQIDFSGILTEVDAAFVSKGSNI